MVRTEPVFNFLFILGHVKYTWDGDSNLETDFNQFSSGSFCCSGIKLFGSWVESKVMGFLVFSYVA